MLANASKRQQMPANESKQKQLSKQKEEGKKNKKKHAGKPARQMSNLEHLGHITT